MAVEEVKMKGASDEKLPAFAARDKRVLVTYNIRDFQLLLIEWHRAARHHSGILFVSEKSIPQRAVGPLVRALAQVLETSLGAKELEDRGLFVVRARIR